MFNRNWLQREAKIPEHDVALETGNEAMKVEHVNIDDDFDYVDWENTDAASNAQLVLGYDATSLVAETRVGLAEEPNSFIDENVEVVHLVEDGNDSRQCTASSVSRNGSSVLYDVDNVIMVSVNENDLPTLQGEGTGTAVGASACREKRNTQHVEDYLTGKTSTAEQSSPGVGPNINKGYCCSKCKKTFDMKRHFLNHLQLHFKCKDFECSECGERFYQRHCLELHRVTHLDVRKGKPPADKHLLFECKLCRTRFSSIVRLKNHISLLHKCTNQTAKVNQNQSTAGRPETGHHICYHCQKTFIDRKTFSKHITVHSTNFECIACPKSFNTKEELKIHSWTHFSFYSCSVCNAVFKSGKELARHEGTCLSKDLVDLVGSDKLFICDVCSDVFVKKQDFQKHLNGHVKRFRCRQCGSGYHSRETLYDHEKCHEFNSRMYKCSDCPKCFYSLGPLQAHQKHHAVESRQCSLCKEVFQSDEQQHRHKHLFLGNVKCNLCSIQCSGSHGLNMHRRLAHPEVHLASLQPKRNSEQIIVCVGDDDGT